MQKKQLSLIIGLLMAFSLYGQQVFELGAEGLKSFGKGYSTTKVAARGENFSDKNSFSAGITWQFASAKAYSVSTGFGFYLGYRRAFGNNLKGSNPFGGGPAAFLPGRFCRKNQAKKPADNPLCRSRLSFCFREKNFYSPRTGIWLYPGTEQGLQFT